MLWHRLAGATAAGLDFVGSKTATLDSGSTLTTSLTNLTGGISSSPIENDIVIVFFANAYDGTATVLSFVTSGYTSIANIHANDTYDVGLLAGYKIMGPTPDTDVSATFTGGIPGEDTLAMAIFVFRNVDTTTPLDVATSTVTLTNTVRANPPAITPVTTGAIIIACGAGAYRDTTNRTYSSSDLSNFISATQSDFNDIVIGAGTYAWVSGSFDPAQFTFSGSDSANNSCAAVTMALRPKPA